MLGHKGVSECAPFWQHKGIAAVLMGLQVGRWGRGDAGELWEHGQGIVNFKSTLLQPVNTHPLLNPHGADEMDINVGNTVHKMLGNSGCARPTHGMQHAPHIHPRSNAHSRRSNFSARALQVLVGVDQ